MLICGRYEGVDERINQLYCDMELSIGDYVLSGGELAAAVVVDATMRLLPGVLGNEASGEFESFGVADAEITAAEDGVPRSQHGAGGLLDYPHYTRPAEFGGLRVPETLLNGDHSEIRRWRREQQLRKTLANRPDLLEGAALSKEDRKMLEAIRRETNRRLRRLPRRIQIDQPFGQRHFDALGFEVDLRKKLLAKGTSTSPAAPLDHQQRHRAGRAVHLLDFADGDGSAPATSISAQPIRSPI